MRQLPVFLLLLLFPLIAPAQQVTQLRIEKAMPELNDDPSLYVEAFIPTDRSGLEYNNPIDLEKSAFTVFRDDAGTDFLAAHQKAQAERKARGYSGDEPILSFGGSEGGAEKMGLFVRMRVDAAPAANASEIVIAGTVVFNYVSEEEPTEILLTEVPVEMDYNDPGFASEIGPIKIEGAGSATTDEGSYEKFRVVGSETPIVSVEVIGGDDADVVSFWGKGPNEFILAEIPETVDLRIRYSSFEKVAMPLDLQFGIGL